MFASIIKADGNFYLLCDSASKSISGWKSESEALAYYEGGYDSCHKRSYESSMSATIHWMQFQPSIIQLEEKEIHSLFTEDELKHLTLTYLSSMAGRLAGVKLTKESSLLLWESGKKPQLIKPE